MTFAWPMVLWLLLAPAALAAGEFARRRRAAATGHPKILRAEAGARTIDLAPAGSPSPARTRPRWWLLAGLALGIVALARPQWGRIDEPLFDQAREILIAIDLSRSMLTPDVKPSRLERAKLLVESLLDRLQGERVGLEAFAGTAFLQAPLSADYEILREFLPELGPDLMPVGGTNYGDLIDTAADAFSDGPADKFLVVLSDGGATDDDWRNHLGKLKSKGIRVIGLGVGTAAGALIPDGAGGFVKDERGAVVMARLESETLREIADKTGGVYRDASEWIDLASLLNATVEAGRKGKFVERNNVRFVERYQWALAPALIFLLLSFWREFPVRPTPRDMKLAVAQDSRKRAGRRRAVAAAAFAGLLAIGGTRATAAGEEPSPDAASAGAPLARVVGRLAAQTAPSALDWAELSSETVAWGRRVQSADQPVPAGPLRDGLAAVEAGSALDSKAADWPRLRGELEYLLRKQQQQPPPPPQQKKQQQQQQQNQQSQQNSQDSQGQGSGQQNQQQDSQQQNAPENKNSQSNPQTPSAFGDMKQQQPPPSGGTQQVGGAKQRPPEESTDPSLAGSMEKLDQVRDQDSPAELFRMIENNNPQPAKTNGKDW